MRFHLRIYKKSVVVFVNPAGGPEEPSDGVLQRFVNGQYAFGDDQNDN